MIKQTCDYCPKTVALLKQIPHIRTALFSRLGSGTKLNPHTGWEDLANHVLRCHVSLVVPEDQCCGLWVDNVEEFHAEGNIIVFDDSKTHLAFNRDKKEQAPSSTCAGSGVGDSQEEEEEEEKEKEGYGVKEERMMMADREKTDRIVLIIDIMRPAHVPLGSVGGGHTPELDQFISQFR